MSNVAESDPVTLARDFDEVRDITVIGAGPVGLSTAFWACLLYTSDAADE